MNKFATNILDCVDNIRTSIDNYTQAIHKIERDYEAEQESIHESYRSEKSRLGAELEAEKRTYQEESDQVTAGITKYYSIAIAHESEFSILDPEYYKKRDHLQIADHYLYPFDHIRDPVREMQAIADRIEQLGIDLLRKRSVIHLLVGNRPKKYAEIKYLVERANTIHDRIQSEVQEHLCKQMSEAERKYARLMEELENSQREQLHQLKLTEATMREKAEDTFKIQLEEMMPPYMLQAIAKRISLYEPDFSHYTHPGEEIPVIQIGTMKVRLNHLDSPERSKEILERYEEFINEDYILMPYAFQFNDICSLLIQSNFLIEDQVNQGVQAVIARMLAQLPPTQLHCIFIDPKNAGRIFSPYMKLSSKDEKIVGKQVFTSQDAIRQALDDVYNHIDHIIQFKLSSGTGFGDIYEYNTFAKENAESYKLLTVLDFPKNFTVEMMEKLLYIIENGSKCGVHVIVTYNSEFVSQYQQDSFEQIINHMGAISNVIQSDRNDLMIGNPSNEILFEFVSPPQSSQLVAFVDELGEQVVIANKRETPFSVIAPRQTDWFAKSSSDSLTIPIGKTGAGEIHPLIFGADTSQHAIIAGKTGSGKTSLLHTLITSACINYSPDELNLFLLDFKEGVEFSEYATHRIPHVKVLALESEQEFGESILIELQQELSRRGDLFKKQSVQNIMNYREKTGQTMPRILLVIDEFQVLFDTQKNRKVAHNCAAILDDLVRRGRSFGIHVILSSQTVSTVMNSSLETSTLSQMAVRIGLKADEKDARVLLGQDNDGIASLGQEVGVAIYNSDAGNATNVKFRIAYLDRKYQVEILQKIGEYSSQQGYVYEAEVFSSQAEATMEDPALLFRRSEDDYGSILWLGKSVRVAPPYTTIHLQYQHEDNVVILGQDEGLARRMIYYSLCSALCSGSHASSETRIIFVDYRPLHNHRNDTVDLLIEQTGSHIRKVSNDSELQKQITWLYEEMDQRRSGGSQNRSPYYLFVHGIQRIRLIIKTADENSFSLDFDQEKPVGKMFLEILNDGPALGIYTIMWCDTYGNLNKFPYGTQDLFGYKIALLLREEDSNKFLGENIATDLKGKFAICRDLSGEFRKFQPFQYPSKEWKSEFIREIVGQG
ncbi:FtsK/SpoIIIE domain-containing protein [Hazenella coriacea]|uniref:FtsK/SpoIIIE family protein n=1 Tax=Hazenella coriacea TaxID=1179467 RepID=A0A4R3LA67_9BACL|nr:FtsK/SpoIIIE domain-containing protein [Hazenella coriacea]TCS96619.1 FtsK/SpoIIIE family protein [Hazenella coriacea]